MNSVNTLFVISVIFVPLLLISLNYSAINDFYTYSVPLNNAVIIPNFSVNDPDEFQKVQNEKDSTCHTTPSSNLFCYKKPRIYNEQEKDHLHSSIVGNNGINGEIHFDRLGLEGGIFTIKNISLIDGKETALITFADKNYRIGNKDRTTYEITEKFEFTTIVEKYDSFITHCGNFDGTGATIVQYLGVTTIYGIDYFVTWHTVILPEDAFLCKYPQLIQYSLKQDFKDL
jgi:hypothetical protein